MKISTLLACAGLVVGAAAADAQEVSLQMQNGLVTLDARNVTVRQILAEWARIGGARIVNGEKVAGGPVTLQLEGIPERQALDTILRNVSGYMLALRQPGGAGVSAFDRILIMPTSTAPRAAAPANPAFVPRPMPVSAEPVETEVMDDDRDDPMSEEPDADAGAEELAEPPQVNPRFQRRPPFGNPMGAPGGPFMGPGQFPGVQATPAEDEEMPAGQPGASPFNVPPGASTMPGVIAPAPQQPQDGPPTRRRPPS